MARASKTYQKLSSPWLTLLMKNGLWQGPDHLLWVEGTIVQEHYKRFYYKDIQALVLHRTNGWLVWFFIWGAFFLLLVALGLWSDQAVLGVSTMAAICLVVLGIHWIKGASCEVFLQTAVQLEKLSCLVRVPKAMKVMDRIKVAAEAAQGPFSPQSLANVHGATASVDPQAKAAFSIGQSSLPADADETVSPYDARLHTILFGLLIGVGLLRCLQIMVKAVPLVLVDMIGLAVTLVLAIIVLVRWSAQVRGTLLAPASWLTMIFAVLHSMAAYGVFIAASMKHPGLAYNHWAVVKAFFELWMQGKPLLQGVTAAVALVSVALGVFGLMATLGQRHHPVRSAPPLV